MSENAALVEYYVNTLIMQYADKPKARAMLSALLTEAEIYDLAILVRDGFNLETAKGIQLDILAKYVGVSRTITGTSFTRDYWGFALYGDTSPFTFFPFTTYGAPPVDVQFRDYKESNQSIYSLNDSELRSMIKLAIIRNNGNASVKDIDDMLYALFGADAYFIDRQNMSVVSYMIVSAYSRLFNIAKSSGLLPNPAAVGTSLIVVPDIENIFAFSLYGEDATPFAIGFVDYFEVWKQYNDSLSIGGGRSAVAYLSETRLVYHDSIAGTLQTYDYSVGHWLPTGNEKAIPGIVSIAKMTDSRIAVYSYTDGYIRAYDFDEIDWSQAGSASGWGSGRTGYIDALSSSRIIANIPDYGGLWVVDFNGSSWSAPHIPTAAPGITTIKALSSTRIVAYNTAGYLQAYDYAASVWSAVGNQFSIDSDDYPSIAALSATRIAFYSSSLGTLQTIDFDGTDWTNYRQSLAIGISEYSSMDSVVASRIMFHDDITHLLSEYDFAEDRTGCFASYS